MTTITHNKNITNPGDQHLDLELLRKEGAGEFVDRLNRIQSLKSQISAIEDTITVKKRVLIRQLSEFPPGLKIPVPWMNNKEVPLEEAIPLFQARERELYLDLRYLRDPLGENYDQFIDLKSHVIRHTEPQFKAHKEKIQEKLKFAKEKREIQDLCFELRWLEREYLTFSQTHSDVISPEVQERLFVAEELIILPDLKAQQDAAARITAQLRSATARIDSVLNEMSSIKHCFLKYHQLQRELINLNNDLNDLQQTPLVIPNEEGELVAMDFNRAYQERYERTEATKGKEDDVRYNLLMQIESDFFQIESLAEEIEETTQQIEKLELRLDNQYLAVKEARTRLDAIAKNNYKCKSISRACHDLLRLNSELLDNDGKLQSIQEPDFEYYFDF